LLFNYNYVPYDSNVVINPGQYHDNIMLAQTYRP